MSLTERRAVDRSCRQRLNRVARTLFVCSLLLYGAHSLYGQTIDYSKLHALISVFKTGSPREIADACSFPIFRRYPVPWISSRTDLIARFSEVFDPHLIHLIAESDPRKDWSAVGWRGIMLGNGLVWLNFDYRVIAVNYETAAEKRIAGRLISKDKDTLPPGLRDFDRPVLKWSTKYHVIRVDQRGTDYRLALFKIGDPAVPELVLHNGKWMFDGNMGSYYIDWTNGKTVYRIYNSVTGDSFMMTFPLAADRPDVWPKPTTIEHPTDK